MALDSIVNNEPEDVKVKQDAKKVVDTRRALRRRKTMLFKTAQIHQDRNIEILRFQNCVKPLFALETILPHLTNLESKLMHLNLANVPLGPSGAAVIGNGLIVNRSLQYLDLSNTRIAASPYRSDYSGINLLAKGLESARSKITYLSVSGNALLPNGIRIICNALSFHKSITALNIAHNGGGSFNDPQSSLSICTLLHYQTHLIWLNASYMHINFKDAHLLKNAIQENITLTYLDLRGCNLERIRTDGFRNLIEHLQGSNPMLTLVLKDVNSFKKEH